MTLLLRRHFDAAHSLPGYPGPCSRLHGHSWRVDVEVSGKIALLSGMVADFKDLQRAIDSVLPDHQHINEVFFGIIPTAENLAGLLYTLIVGAVFTLDPSLVVEKVMVWESDDAAAIFTRDDAASNS